MKQHFHIFHAMPGCLPDGDVTCVDSAGWALRVWREDFTVALNAIEDDGEFLEVDTRLNLVTEFDIENNAGESVELGDGYRYTIERVDTDRAECELAAVDA
jgi:hypothetical protein